MAHAIEVEIERNFSVFKDMLEELLERAAGKYALLHNQSLEGLYPTAAAAGRAGFDKFGARPFSIQLVSDEPVDLGFYSYANTERTSAEQ
ncbi:hypothetical protein P7228_06220 [Altererythrobacter arenosus]|uniref:Uncharacterized protein n=1 Tax=Altererythrobacter arenosus TaxID=3032592 RepID=A0ABY8FUH8_9SPHN|nr:hypothetical protein [Altererythrobacter sp. CAU 1644]WFL78656.1 hypothetical protein P7228_06220 [Altererythrobacter sp. CAU 1644]